MVDEISRRVCELVVENVVEKRSLRVSYLQLWKGCGMGRREGF